MRYGTSTRYMLDFIRRYIDEEVEQWEFDLDFDAFIMQHFPIMERENAGFAEAFELEIMATVDLARVRKLSEDQCRDLLADGYDNLLAYDPKDYWY